MTTNLYSFVDIFDRALDTAAHILTKGAEFAKTNGVSETEMLGWRLIGDMEPLRFQLMVVCNFTQQWPARAVGLPVPADIEVGLSVAEFQTAIAASKAYLAALKPEQFAGRDDVPMTVSLGNGTWEPTFSTERWLTTFANTNILFHLSTAYGILRSQGVAIGKVDLFSTPM